MTIQELIIRIEDIEKLIDANLRSLQERQKKDLTKEDEQYIKNRYEAITHYSAELDELNESLQVATRELKRQILVGKSMQKRVEKAKAYAEHLLSTRKDYFLNL